MAQDRAYTPPLATATALDEMLSTYRISRCVVVAAAVYGSANAATLDAVQQLGQHRARAVAWLPRDRSDANLRRLKAAGVAGFRVLPDAGAGMDRSVLFKKFQEYFRVAVQWNWHLDIAAPPDLIKDCYAQLASSPVPLVFDTFAWIMGGPRQAGVDAILSLVSSGAAYVKLSEPYRLAENSRMLHDLRPVVDALIAANPDRILWGSGWPYVSGPTQGRPVSEITPNLPIDTGTLLGLFCAWVPDESMRRRILVDNPARLYGFGNA